MTCPGCFSDFKKGYCLKCRKELFDGKKVQHILPFNSPYVEESDLFPDNTKKISISGVQIKYSLKLGENQLTLASAKGEYILKPIPTGTFKYLDQAPANEHLTMQIARQVYKIPVPPNALIFFKDGSPAYLVKRFDYRPDGGKIPQEDFAQIAQRTSKTHGENYKYDSSYEEIAGLIEKYIPTYRIELEKYFRLILFNYLFSNGDAHLKNFSAFQSSQGDYVLTPAYDLLCTKIHSPSESEMALTLFKDGFSDVYEAYGFYTYHDFYQFGVKIGIKNTRVKRILSDFIQSKDQVYILIEQSFLNNETKTIYRDYYEDRMKRLNMNISQV